MTFSSQEMQSSGSASSSLRRSSSEADHQRPGVRRVDPADAVRHGDGLQMSGPDVRQALRHPPRVQDARQVCAQRHGADTPCSRSEG